MDCEETGNDIGNEQSNMVIEKRREIYRERGRQLSSQVISSHGDPSAKRVFEENVYLRE